MTDRARATIVRGLKVVASTAGLTAITVAWTYFQSNGADLGFDPPTLALVLAVGNPLILAAEKWLRWVSDPAAA